MRLSGVLTAYGCVREIFSAQAQRDKAQQGSSYGWGRRWLGGRFCALILIGSLTYLSWGAEAFARRGRVSGGGYQPPYASMVYDANTGRVLEATNPDALRHPASITKVMTLYMLFEQLESGRFKLSSELPVSRKAASQAPSKLGLKPGETISVEDAIKALVTKSANDVAVIIAEALGGDEANFTTMMTKKARAIGMKRSVFYNASGLPHPGQWTTARDLVTLGKVIQSRFPKYYTYFSTHTFNYEGRAYRNHNRLLGQIEGVDGIKTGYTYRSGFNLLTSAKANRRHIITVVLGGRTGRERDIKVAGLIEKHIGSAYAGGESKARSVDLALRDEEEVDDEAASSIVEERADRTGARNHAQLLASGVGLNQPITSKVNNSASQLSQGALASVPSSTASSSILPSQDMLAQRPPVGANVVASIAVSQPSVNVPHPPARPRLAGNNAASGADVPMMRAKPLSLAASGSTQILQKATTPMALVSSAPARLGEEKISSIRQESRLIPPGNVRYTNSILPVVPANTNNEEAILPLPTMGNVAANSPLSLKNEERVPSLAKRMEMVDSSPVKPEGAIATDAPVASIESQPVRNDNSANKEPNITASAGKSTDVKGSDQKTPEVKKQLVQAGWFIQLAAAESEEKAHAILQQVTNKVGTPLKQAQAYTESVRTGKTTFYRARLRGFDEEKTAQAACKSIKQSGFSCFIQKI